MKTILVALGASLVSPGDGLLVLGCLLVYQGIAE